MSNPKLQVFDSHSMPWEDRFIPETGVTVRLVKYPAGFTNIWHTHPCAHGMYVLEGTLVTHDGSFGPGSFVWFPEGMKMQHGATQTEDVAVLFLTNKTFEIHYAQ